MSKTLRAKSRTTIAKYILAGLLIVISTFLASCTSQIPVATNYPYTEQQKMQAAHHWEVLAGDVVEQLAQNDVVSKTTPLFVAPKFYVRRKENPVIWTAANPLTKVDESDRFVTIPFKRAYHNFLITELVKAGYNVVDIDETEAMRMTFDVQVVKHNGRPVCGPHLISVLGRLLAGGLDGAYEDIEATEYEVIITTSVKHRNVYLMSHTGIYYIPKPAWDDNYQLQGTVVEVVNQ